MVGCPLDFSVSLVLLTLICDFRTSDYGLTIFLNVEVIIWYVTRMITVGYKADVLLPVQWSLSLGYPVVTNTAVVHHTRAAPSYSSN